MAIARGLYPQVRLPGNTIISRSFSVVEIGPGPRARLDKDPYPCCSAVEHKFTHPVVWRSRISPVVSVAERGPRVRAAHGRLRIDVGPAVAIPFPV